MATHASDDAGGKPQTPDSQTPKSQTPNNVKTLRPRADARPAKSGKRPGKITVPWVREAKGRGEPVVMVTAYDYPQARAADEAGIDLVLMGDSVAMVVLGHDDTLALTVDEALHHVKAVRRGTERALLVADMPYGSFHLGPAQAVENALRFVKEGGAQAVKIEGARPEVVAALVSAEIPVMAHLGLTPQSLHRFGGFKVQGKDDEARRALHAAARALEDAGAFSLVLECIPADLAAEVTDALSIPTLGIGAGPACLGQVLVWHDLLGVEDRMAPKFVRRYASHGDEARRALRAYADDVRARRFPSAEESFGTVAQPRDAEAPSVPLYGETVYG